MPLISSERCLKCKTFKRLCGLDVCPVVERLKIVIRTRAHVTRSFQGSTPPSAVVGEHGYPEVNVVFNVVPGARVDEAKMFEDPEQWWSRLGLIDIVRIRANMVSVVQRLHVEDIDKLHDKEISAASTSQRPVSSEVSVRKVLNDKMIFSLRLFPLSVQVDGSIRVTSNPVIPRPLERVMWDDVDARTAVVELYSKGVDVYTIQRALSLGLLGARRRRRLVPTRWAITAVDRILSDHLRRSVRRMRVVNSFEVYTTEYIHNRFIVILIPDSVRIKLVEAWHPRGDVSEIAFVEHEESISGRIESIDGGFEAIRFGLLEYMARRGEQASAIVLREILPQYYIGVGNWHLRESMRRLDKATLALRANRVDEVIRWIRENVDERTREALERSLLSVTRQLKLL